VRFSYQLLPEQPVDELLDLIELLDELGFWACYSADETYHKDMWSIFSAAAARTARIRLGPEVTHVILKDPTIIAQQVATLDELTAGRAELVYSTGNFAMLKQYRVELGGKPIARLREAHHVLRSSSPKARSTSRAISMRTRGFSPRRGRSRIRFRSSWAE
jgi:5,10-methylenetetrahydromethanopterin reductase